MTFTLYEEYGEIFKAEGTAYMKKFDWERTDYLQRTKSVVDVLGRVRAGRNEYRGKQGQK